MIDYRQEKFYTLCKQISPFLEEFCSRIRVFGGTMTYSRFLVAFFRVVCMFMHEKITPLMREDGFYLFEKYSETSMPGRAKYIFRYRCDGFLDVDILLQLNVGADRLLHMDWDIEAIYDSDTNLREKYDENMEMWWE